MSGGTARPGWKPVTVALPEDLLERLRLAGERRVVGRNLIIAKAVRDLLDAWDENGDAL